MNQSQQSTSSEIARLFHQAHPSLFTFDPCTQQLYALDPVTNIWRIDDDFEYLNKVLIAFTTNPTTNNSKAVTVDTLAIIQHVLSSYAVTNASQVMNQVNPSLFAFLDGVFDLALKQYRKPMANEYVSTTCGFEYYESVPELPKLKCNARQLFIDMVPKEHERIDLLRLLASALRVNTDRKQLHVLELRYDVTDANTNPTNSNKVTVWDTITQLIDWVFGHYYTSLDTSSLVSSTNVDLLQLNQCRLVLLNSTSNSEYTNPMHHKIEELTSPIPTRVICPNNNTILLSPKFTTVVPIFANHGTNLLESPSVAVHKITLANDDMIELKTYLELPSRQLGIRLGLFHLLLDYYEDGFSVESRNVTHVASPVPIHNQTSVSSNTSTVNLDQPISANDPIITFINDMIERTNNPKDRVHATLVFKSFIAHQNNNSTSIKSSQLESIAIAKGIIITKTKGNKYYRGIKLKTT